MVGDVLSLLLRLENICEEIQRAHRRLELFSPPIPWLSTRQSAGGPHYSLDYALANVRALQMNISREDYGFEELQEAEKKIRKLQLRCNSFFHDLKDLILSYEAVLATKVLNKTDEDWLKRCVLELRSSLFDLIEAESYPSTRQDIYREVFAIHGKLSTLVGSSTYEGVDGFLRYGEDLLISLELEVLMGENH